MCRGSGWAREVPRILWEGDPRKDINCTPNPVFGDRYRSDLFLGSVKSFSHGDYLLSENVADSNVKKSNFSF